MSTSPIVQGPKEGAPRPKVPSITIAIDGPASSGKGTVARVLAARLGYTYLDTGSLYRVVGLRTLQAGLSTKDGPSVGALARSLRIRFVAEPTGARILENEQDLSTDIRTEAVGQAASDVATLPEVRSALLAIQRELGGAGGVVVDGRDIGTVVLPQAQLKLFLDASLAVRARRRFADLLARGLPAQLSQIEADLALRDHQDSSRQSAPLRQAADAIYLDSSGRSVEEVIESILTLPILAGRAHNPGANNVP